MSALINYTVFGYSATQIVSTSYKFLLNVKGSSIMPVITTNLLTSNVLDMGMTGVFEMNASGSYFPGDPLKKRVCSWNCPQQIVQMKQCPYQGCDISFNIQ
jgi:polyferredoxin